jgi:cation-transporting ATPase E
MAEAQTGTMVTMSVTGIWVLSTLARPLNGVKLGIFVGMVALGAAIFTVPLATGYFGFSALTLNQVAIAGGIGLAGAALIELASRLQRNVR